jgi:hypothetical protein
MGHPLLLKNYESDNTGWATRHLFKLAKHRQCITTAYFSGDLRQAVDTAFSL